MLFWGIFSLCLGGLFGGYCRLLYTAKALLLSWRQLLRLALKKREVLQEIAALQTFPLLRLEEEMAFLKQGSFYSLKEFLKASDADGVTFYEMERFFTLRLKQTLASLQESLHQEAVQHLMEELLAYENAFSFEAFAFEKAAETYTTLHGHPVIQFSGKLFRFPQISFPPLDEAI